MTLAELQSQRHQIIFETIAGSRAYGYSNTDSDTDVRGVYVVPKASYLSLEVPAAQTQDDKGDVVYYSLRRYLELLASGNPNMVELLFAPTDCLRVETPIWQRLLKHRHRFVTKACVRAHESYASAQIKKARGRNKWVNNPQSEEPPAKEAFCWVVLASGHEREEGLPLRPVALAESDIDLSACHCAAMAHAPGVYRLYHYGGAARGVFRGDMLVCESVPAEDERERCIGLLIYNEAAWNRAMKNHRHYWDWRRNRNDARWQDQEAGTLDYDAKNMMHMIRLLLSARAIVQTGAPLVRFSGDALKLLKDIRAARFSYEEIVTQADEFRNDVLAALATSRLEESVELTWVDRLLEEMTDEWEREHGR